VSLRFHPLVQSDVKLALEYFDREGGSKLCDRFFVELQGLLARIESHPKRYGFFEGDIRRASLRVFRYHLLYRIRPYGVRILALRHNRRSPRFGISRR
jgi:plasmid stabilization system protein ParE